MLFEPAQELVKLGFAGFFEAASGFLDGQKQLCVSLGAVEQPPKILLLDFITPLSWIRCSMSHSACAVGALLGSR